ncbi:hypothetical protein ES702_03177 [subsurface metagenome]
MYRGWRLGNVHTSVSFFVVLLVCTIVYCELVRCFLPFFIEVDSDLMVARMLTRTR